jgi:hypothetical protein
VELVVHAAPGSAEVETTLVYAGKPPRRSTTLVLLTAGEPAKLHVE